MTKSMATSDDDAEYLRLREKHPKALRLGERGYAHDFVFLDGNTRNTLLANLYCLGSGQEFCGVKRSPHGMALAALAKKGEE